jgi:hypothetical protein
MKHQRRIVGAVHSVPLEDGTYIYAVALPEADFAFMDTRSTQLSNVSEVFSYPILFRVAVHKSAWKTGRWPKVGKVEISESVLAPQPTFIHDPLRPDKFEIYLAGEIRPATKAECDGLECCSVWEPEHVEDRLRDHYEGKTNKWVELLHLR